MNTFYHDQKNDSTIKSVHKALDIVDYVADNPKGISVTDLSEGLQINKSTVSKMLATLECIIMSNRIRKHIATV